MLEQIRDVIIIICAFLVIASALTFLVLTIVIFRFVSSKVVKPLKTGAIFTAGIRKAIVTLSKRSRGKEERNGNGK